MMDIVSLLSVNTQLSDIEIYLCFYLLISLKMNHSGKLAYADRDQFNNETFRITYIRYISMIQIFGIYIW
jgi:hypothetical protein